MKHHICLFFLLFSISFLSGQINVFTESFNESGTSGFSNEGVGWNSMCPGCGNQPSANGSIYLNHNSDGPDTWITNPIDISTCSSISFSIEYTGMDWFGSGPNNLESNDECVFGAACPGDPNNGLHPDCLNCWDFFYYELNVDGSTINTNTVGNGFNPISQTFTFGPACLNSANSAEIKVITQTWAMDENISFDNIALICFEGANQPNFISASPGTMLCEGDNLLLSIPPGYSNVNWSGPAGVNSGTNWNIGAILPSESGTYTVTVSDMNGCTSSSSLLVSVDNGATPNLTSYGPACITNSPTLLNAIEDGISGSWMGPGVSGPTWQFDPSIGVGTYMLTFVPDPGQCAAMNSTNITVISEANASFSYPSMSYCTTDPNPFPSVALGGGIFSISGGAFINPVTGEINLASANPGANYTVTYFVDAVCPGTATFEITIGLQNDADFSLTDSVCKTSSVNPVPISIEQPGVGSFFISDGATINQTTGEIDLSTVNENTTYEVIYIIFGLCGDEHIESIFIEESEDASFTYDEISYCIQNETNPFPDFIATPGGTFSIDGAASINAATGEIDLSTTSSGNSYTVTYSTMGACPSTANVIIFITGGVAIEFDDFGPLCEFDSPLLLPGISNNGIMGTWDIGAQFDPLGNGGTSTSITFMPTPGICASNYTSTISVESQLDGGEDSAIEICEGDVTDYNFFSLLNGSPDMGGSWSDDDVSGVDPNIDPAAVNLGGLTIGTYSYTYTVSSSSPCVDSSAIITVDVKSAPNAGISTTITICSEQGDQSVDLFSIVGAIDLSGFWIDTDLSEVDLSNPGSVNLGFLSPGTYEFDYIVTNNNDCQLIQPHIIANCDDNGTIGDNSDDQFYYSIEVPAVNQGTSLSISGDDTQLNLNYNQLVGPFGPFSYNDGNLSLSITDDENLLCPTLNVDLDADQICAQNCSLLTPSIRTFCDNNGTENDPSDDFYKYYIFVSALNGSTSFSITGDDSRDNLVYNQVHGPFGSFLIMSGNLNIQISDDSESMCTINSVIEAPESCSDECEFDKATVTVDVNEVPNAGTDGNISFCEGEMNPVDFFSAINDNPDMGGIWTDIDASGVDLNIDPENVDISSLLEGAYQFDYTVTGIDPCIDSTASLVLNISRMPNAGLSATVPICNNGMTTLDFLSIIGSHDSGGSWSDDDGSGINPNISPASVDFAGLSSGTYGYTYLIPASGTCPEAMAEIMVSVQDAPNAGTDGSISFCEGEMNPVDFFAAINDNPDMGGVWVDLDASGIDPNFDPENVDISSLLEGTYQFDYTVIGTDPCIDSTASLVLNISSMPNAGMSGMASICNNGMSTLDFLSILGSHDSGGSWSDDDGSGINPNISPASVDFAGLSSGTYGYTYLIPASGTCPEAMAEIMVSVQDAPNAGTDGSISFCEGEMNPVDFFAAINDNPDMGGIWVDLDASGIDPNIDPNNVDVSGLVQGSYHFTYTVSGVMPCEESSSEITLDITGMPFAGINGVDTICNYGSTILDFNAVLNNPDSGGNWTDLNGSGIDPNGDPTAVNFEGILEGDYEFNYAIAAVGSCPEVSAVVTITVQNVPNAGQSALIDICEGDSNPYNFFSSLNGTPDTGGNWVDVDVSGIDANIDPLNVNLGSLPNGMYDFNYVVAGTSYCSDSIATLTLNIFSQSNAGTSNVLNVCDDMDPALIDFDTALGLHDLGGIWIDNDATGIDPNPDPNNVDVGSLTPGVYTFSYELAANGPCAASSSTIQLIVEPTVNSGNDTGASFCQSDVEQVDLLAELNGLPDNGGTWTQLFGPAILITNNDADFTNASSGFYQFKYLLEGVLSCPSDSSILDITILNGPNAGENAMSSACNTDLDALVDLEAMIGVHDLGGTWEDISVTGVDLSDPSMVNFNGIAEGDYIFDYIVDGFAQCPENDTSRVVISVISSPDPGTGNAVMLCEGLESNFDLFNALDGTPDLGGFWTDDSSTGVDLSDPNNVDLTSLVQRPFGYDFTYHIDFAGCDEQMATVTFVVGLPTNAGTDSTMTLCEGETSLINFNDALTNHDTGAWIDLDATGLNFSDANNVDVSSLSPNSYQFLHETASSVFCPSDSAFVILIIQDDIYAGEDSLGSSFCQGENLNLSTFLTGDAGGTIVDPISTGALSGDMLNTNGLAEGPYDFLYVIPAQGVCQADTAIISLDIFSPNSAGDDRGSSLCADQTIDLMDLINGESGGDFTEINSVGALSGSVFDPNSLIIDTYDFYYSVGDGLVCAADTAIISIELDPIPEIVLSEDLMLCDGDCVDMSYELVGTAPFIISFDLFDFNLDLTDILLILSTNNTGAFTICQSDIQSGFLQDTLFLNNSVSEEWSIFPSVVSDNFCFREYLTGGDTVHVLLGEEIVTEVNDILCPGDSVIVNSQVYNELNPSGQEIVSNGFCDSLFNIDLSYYQLGVTNIDSSLCFGDALTIGTTLFDENNLAGTVLLENLGSNGCDSVVNVQLTYKMQIELFDNSTLCADEFIEYNQIRYDINNPAGRDTLIGMNSGECDSIVIIDLSFYPLDTFLRADILCMDEELMIDGEVFDVDNPTGFVLLDNQNVNGCDSVIEVSLGFYPLDTFLRADILCMDEELMIDGEVFDVDNPTGFVLLDNQNVNGCDSVIEVSLGFYPQDTALRSDILCMDEELMIEGEVFDVDNPTGFVLLDNQNVNGCDSVIEVSLGFYPLDTALRSDILCMDEELMIEGEVFDVDNPTGFVLLDNQNVNGCDSVIEVSLGFYPLDTTLRADILCMDEELMIEGEVFDIDNPTGFVLLDNQNVNGCDSVIEVSLGFYPMDTTLRADILCMDEELMIEGEVFDVDNPTGFVLLDNQNVNGCDSVIEVSLGFYPLDTALRSDILCMDEELMIEGEVFDIDNPTGFVLLDNQNVNGCDSVIEVSLGFYPMDTTLRADILCMDEELMIEGEVFDVDNPTGFVLLDNQNVNGCDSVIEVSLGFYPMDTTLRADILCMDEELMIEGEVFDVDNPTGFVLLANQNVNGCDSVIEVSLGFYPLDTTLRADILCMDEELMIDGEVFDVDNPTGFVLLANQNVNGCDSVIEVSLGFYPQDTTLRVDILCMDEELMIEGEVFDVDNPTGFVLLANQNVNGCDSVIEVSLGFYPQDTTLRVDILCMDEELMIEGEVFDVDNPTGFVLLDNQNMNGCDSVIEVSLGFYPLDTFLRSDILCMDEELMIEGEVFDVDNPTGFVLLDNQNVNGCDSVIEVSLGFYPLDTALRADILCMDEELMIEGEVFDVDNPTGFVLLDNQNVNGCDSVIEVSLGFYPLDTTLRADILCMDEELMIEGEVFDVDNPTGFVLLDNQNVNGCDSVIEVSLGFYPLDTALRADILCMDEELMIEGEVFDVDNPTGFVLLDNQNVNGCDSVIEVSLGFYPLDTTLRADILCMDEELMIEGEVFDVDNPTGFVLLDNQNVNGCDSVIEVSLGFYPIDTTLRDDILCPEEEVLIGSETFNMNNPTGFIVFENSNSNGCDSTIEVALRFHIVEDQIIDDVLCEGDTIEVNDTKYYFDNPSGTELLNNASTEGCDVLVQIDLMFEPTEEGSYLDTFCAEEEFILSGEVFNINRPTGTVLLENAAQNGCDSLVNVDLAFVDILPEVIPLNTCQDESLGGIQIEDVIGGMADFLIVLDGNAAFTVSNFPYLIENVPLGNHSVFIQDQNGCSFTANVNIANYPSIQIIGETFYITNKSTPVNIDLESNSMLTSIQWFPETGLSCADCIDPIVNVSVSTEYVLVVTDENGCEFQIEISIQVNPDQTVYIPNVIAPQGSINSEFYLQSAQDLEAIYEFMIFDRWGNLIYKVDQAIVNDPSFAWDGRYNGEIVNPGVYVYYAKVYFPDGNEQILKGDLTVLR